MKAVFVGGGSFRILPVLRGAFAHKKIFSDGEIRLVDLRVDRARAVGQMLMRTPEFSKLKNCKISWTKNLDKALDGADLLYVTMATGSPLPYLLSGQASMRRGFITSNQLSVTGAFLSLTGSKIILNFARKMEKLCPKATMMIFANPVAVYSALVNNHTNINAMGICAGFVNHRWDLTRLMGQDAYRDDYDLKVAGVNHMSFILGGKCKEGEIYSVLGKYLTNSWKPIALTGPSQGGAPSIRLGLKKLAEMYHRFGKIIFSTELDGVANIFYEDVFAHLNKNFKYLTKSQVRAQVKQQLQSRDEADRKLSEYAKMDLDDTFWTSANPNETWFGRSDGHIAVSIFKALAGLGRSKIATSYPNRGAIPGFKDRTVLEYTQYLDNRGLRPAGKYEIPDCFQGITSAIATHQTLLADASATGDPKIFADALFSYPIKQNSRDARKLFKELLEIHKDDIPSCFQKTRDWL